MDTATYQQIIGEIGTLITIFAPLLTAYKLALALGLDDYIESKISLIKDDKLRNIAENIKTRVENITVNTITMIEAVEKPIIIEGIKNGSMTKDDLTSLKNKAIETIKSQLTTEGQTDLQNTVGDVNSYLNALVEAKLADSKVNSTSSISKTVLPEVIIPIVDTTELTNQLSQIQIERDNLQNQLNQVANDKLNIEQTNNQLAQQLSNLQIEKDTVQSKYDVIVNAVTSTPIVDNSVQNTTNISSMGKVVGTVIQQ